MTQCVRDLHPRAITSSCICQATLLAHSIEKQKRWANIAVWWIFVIGQLPDELQHRRVLVPNLPHTTCDIVLPSEGAFDSA